MSQITPTTDAPVDTRRVVLGSESAPAPAPMASALAEATHVSFPTRDYKPDPSGAKMRALVWRGANDVRVETVPKPAITDDRDAIVRVTATTICGSDLHLYHNFITEMRSGDVLGHEAVGIVEQVGPNVKNLKPGDRVIVSAVIACGECTFCREGKSSLCDTTNPSKSMEHLYGHRTAGLYGYSHLTGGFAGGQADFVRVPIADVNCFNISHIPQAKLPDEIAVLVADVLCTSFHGCDLAKVKEGDVVAVWGAGPIGLATAMWAKHLGARRVIVIDKIADRLRVARETLDCDTLNYEASSEDVVTRLAALVPGGPDVCIECAGSRYAKSWTHAVMKAVKLETDAGDTLSEIMRACRKGGRVALIGDFIGWVNGYPIGAQMEKGLTVRGGQLWTHRDWKMCVDKLVDGSLDASWLVTHKVSLADASAGYQVFDDKHQGSLKVVLIPGMPSKLDEVGGDAERALASGKVAAEE